MNLNLKNIFKKNKNQKENIDNRLLKKWFQRTIIFLENNSWIFTVIFLITIFIFSFWVWWSCLYMPKPSERVLKEVSASRKSFEQLISEIKDGIEILENHKTKLIECKIEVFGKEIFATKEEAEWILRKEEIISLNKAIEIEEELEQQKERNDENQQEINKTQLNENQNNDQNVSNLEKDVKFEEKNKIPSVLP